MEVFGNSFCFPDVFPLSGLPRGKETCAPRFLLSCQKKARRARWRKKRRLGRVPGEVSGILLFPGMGLAQPASSLSRLPCAAFVSFQGPPDRFWCRSQICTKTAEDAVEPSFFQQNRFDCHTAGRALIEWDKRREKSSRRTREEEGLHE